MGHVYSNGMINIVATASSEREDEHFLCERPRHVAIPYCITKGKSLLNGNVCFDTATEEEDEPATWNSLLRRGWIAQERLLAPRTITFGAKTLLWECREATFNEREFLCPGQGPLYRGYAGEYYGFITQDQNSTLASLLAFDAQEVPDEEHRNACYTYWRRVLAGYTKAELTFSNDRLIAIGGIAGLLAPNLGDDYIAGVWSGDTVRSLLWMSLGRLIEGPTWSWGSYNGQIRFPLDEIDGLSGEWQVQLQEHFTVCHTAVELSGPSRYGPVSSGVLELNCIVHEVLYDAIKPGLSSTRPYAGYKITGKHSAHCGQEEACSMKSLMCNAQFTYGWRDDLHQTSTEQSHRLPNGRLLKDEPATALFVLPVASWDDAEAYPPSNHWNQSNIMRPRSHVVCLLLTPVEHCIDTYQRLPELCFLLLQGFDWKLYPRRNIKII